MREPIDDERLSAIAARVRAIGVAAIAGVVVGGGAGAVVAMARDAGDPRFAWVAACTTFVVTWWASPRHPNDVLDVFARPASAGAIVGAASVMPFLARDVASATLIAAFASIVGATLGATCGMGVSIRASWRALRGSRRMRDVTSALARDALGCALLLAPAVALEQVVPAMGIAAGVLALASLLVARGAMLESARRRAFVRRAERDEVAGWRVEIDEKGTRWLVREERGGEGAYREGVMSRRWARV